MNQEMNQDNILGIEKSGFNATNERKSVKKAAVDWKSILIYAVLALILIVAAGTVIYTKLNKHRGNAQPQSLNDFSSATVSQPEEVSPTQVENDPLSPEGFAIGQQAAANNPALPEQPVQSSDAQSQQSSSPMVSVEQGGDKFYLPQHRSEGLVNQEQKGNGSSDIAERVNSIEKKLESVPSKEEFASLLTEINSVKLMLTELNAKSEANKPTKPSVRRSTHNSKPVKMVGAPVPRASNSTTVRRQTVPTSAKTLPALKLRAVVQDQAWLENASGETISVSISNPYISGYGKVVRFDGENFKICFDSGKCISQ
ncbi:hypothetical protein AADX40_15560 [Aeromonas veronii]|uniref:hypothetical protein n=1 Tax=Aeromonas veronii TaxID=654 RepID=UPI0031590B03